MSRLARPYGNEPSGIVSGVDVLVHDHRRYTDQVAFFPRVLRSVVQIVNVAFVQQQQLLEFVAVRPAPFARCNLLRHDV